MDVQMNKTLVVTDVIGQTNCNKTDTGLPDEDEYDSEGAMRFTVAVVMVYGVAVIGVFVLSYYSKRQIHNQEIDKQARMFFKDLPSIRLRIEKDARKMSKDKIISGSKSLNLNQNMLKYKDRKGRMKSVGNGLLSYIAVPLLVSDSDEDRLNDHSPSSSRHARDVRADIQRQLEVLKEENEEDIVDDDVFIEDDCNIEESCNV